jgi:hypothetical protein
VGEWVSGWVRDSAVVAEKDFVWTAVFELLYLCFLK